MLGAMVTACGVGHESVAVICGVNVPNSVGVPDTRPELEMLMPLGNRMPDHRTAPKPPEEDSWKLYALPCVPLGRVCEVIESAGQAMVRLNTTAAVLAIESVAVMVKLNVPGVVGVPVMTPVDVLSARPPGRLPVSA